MKTRESNFELLRNLAMFMVLMIHANFVSLPRPLTEELAIAPASTAFRYLVESLGIVCVDVFVLISGWFRVNTRLKSVLNFIFQVLFFWIGGYVVCLLLGKAKFTFDGALHCFAFTKWDWFIKAYLVLYIIAPILNAFVDKASERQHRNVLVAFLLFQSTYGWLGGARFFMNGYGPLSFIGLYLLAQYVRRVSGKGRKTLFDFPKHVDLIVFLVSAIINTVLSLAFLKAGRAMHNTIYAFINPIVIIGALYLLLFFSKLEIGYNKIINWFGASSFAVYLLHSQVDVRKIFTSVIVKLDSGYHGIAAVGLIFLFLLLTYLVSVLADQLRIGLWNLVWNRWGTKTSSAT
ncbi:MAG: acyltransferase family protein [Bacteroidales bacterium]|nr:acyltransferase family protein [Bacteroidales bacterium]